jgi:ligand-binding SRPBCC domain-containing protein
MVPLVPPNRLKHPGLLPHLKELDTSVRNMAHTLIVRDEILVRAPAERCFLLSTSVAIVECDLEMHPVRGRTSGLVIAGDTVRWQGWQLGLPQFHESLIGPYEPYVFFQDRMIAGRFQSFEHHHRFTDKGDGTVLMSDEVRFTMPLGWAGDLVGRCLLVPHIRRLLKNRFARLKRIAEGEEWKLYLPESNP